MATQTPDEIIEQQRKDSTKAYADKVSSLVSEIHILETQKEDIQNVLKEAFTNKQKELDEIHADLLNKRQADEAYHLEAVTMLRDAKSKMEESDKGWDSLEQAIKDHEENVSNYNSTVQNSSENFSKREAICLEKEKAIEDRNIDSDNRLVVAVEAEKRAADKILELQTLAVNVNEEIVKNKEIQDKNTLLLDDINNNKSVLVELNKSIDEDRKKVIAERLAVDNDRKSLALRKTDLDLKDDEIRDKNIKYAVDSQRLIDKQKDIDTQIGKLNELKNQVDSLIKIQQTQA